MDENDGGPPGRPAHLFAPGNSYGAGRPKGSRNKLGEKFLLDLQAAWDRHGAAAVERMAETTPAAFVRVVAQTLPKYLNVTVNDYEQLSYAELVEQFMAAADELGLVVIQPADGGGGAGEAGLLGLPKPD